MDAIWEPLIEKAYSFIVKNDHNRTIGVALNFDANDEPEAPMVGGLCTIFLFLDYLEVPIKYVFSIVNTYYWDSNSYSTNDSNSHHLHFSPVT